MVRAGLLRERQGQPPGPQQRPLSPRVSRARAPGVPRRPGAGQRTLGFERCQLCVFANWACLLCQPNGVSREAVSLASDATNFCGNSAGCVLKAPYFPKTTDRLCLGQCRSHSRPAQGASLAAAPPATSLRRAPCARDCPSSLAFPAFIWAVAGGSRPARASTFSPGDPGPGTWSLWVECPQLYKGNDSMNICPWGGPENAVTKPLVGILARGARRMVG